MAGSIETTLMLASNGREDLCVRRAAQTRHDHGNHHVLREHDERARSRPGRACERVGAHARRLRPRAVAAAVELGPLGCAVRGSGLHRRLARLAGRPGDGRGGKGQARGLRAQERRPDRRLCRRDHPPAREETRRDRPFVRRTARADHRRPRPRDRHGRDRPGTIPRRAAVADLGTQVGVAGPQQSGQPQPRGAAHIRAVPLRLRERGRREGGEGAVRDLLRSRLRCADLPGRIGEPQPVDRSEGRHEESGARAVADHRRRAGPHGAAGDCEGRVQAPEGQRRRA